MKNPFNYVDKLGSSEMKALLKELEFVTAKICLLHAEEQGTGFDSNLIQCAIKSEATMAIVKFRAYAGHELATQPECDLSDDDKIAVASHETFKRLTEKLYGQ